MTQIHKWRPANPFPPPKPTPEPRIQTHATTCRNNHKPSYVPRRIPDPSRRYLQANTQHTTSPHLRSWKGSAQNLPGADRSPAVPRTRKRNPKCALASTITQPHARHIHAPTKLITRHPQLLGSERCDTGSAATRARRGEAAVCQGEGSAAEGGQGPLMHSEADTRSPVEWVRALPAAVTALP